MGELSESLKKVSLGSILVVVGVVTIASLGVYWYVFSKEDSPIPAVSTARPLTAGEVSRGSIPDGSPGSRPDDRMVIVETPSSETELPAASGSDPGQTAAPETVSPAATVVESGTRSGGLTIQAGAFTKAEGADSLAAQLRDKGFPSSIVSSQGVNRVYVGDYASRTEAEGALARLKNSGFSGYIRTMP